MDQVILSFIVHHCTVLFVCRAWNFPCYLCILHHQRVAKCTHNTELPSSALCLTPPPPFQPLPTHPKYDCSLGTWWGIHQDRPQITVVLFVHLVCSDQWQIAKWIFWSQNIEHKFWSIYTSCSLWYWFQALVVIMRMCFIFLSCPEVFIVLTPGTVPLAPHSACLDMFSGVCVGGFDRVFACTVYKK